MAYKPTYTKKCTLVLMDEYNRPIINTAKKMFGGEDKANAYGQVFIKDYNKKRGESDPVAMNWLVSV